MARGYLHAAFESIPGNEVNSPTLSTKVIYMPLISFTSALKPSPMTRDDEVRNIDEPLQILPERYKPDWSLETRLYPDSAGFMLKAMLGAPVTTAGDGIITDPGGTIIPSGVTRHVWTAPFGPSGLNPQTAQFQASYVDQAVFWKMKGCAVTQLAIDSPETGGCRLKASGLALYMARQNDPALTPAYEALSVRPFTRSNLTIATWLASTAVTQDFTFQIANQVVTQSTLGVASRFDDDMEKGDPPIIATGTIPKRVIASADWDAALANTGFATLVQWISDTKVGVTSYPFSLFVQMTNAQYTDGTADPLMNKRRHGGTYSFKATNASGTAGHLTITLCNATTSYA